VRFTPPDRFVLRNMTMSKLVLKIQLKQWDYFKWKLLCVFLF
jgi:hypothetical protein